MNKESESIMKKVVIHGANQEGQKFAMRANYVFDILAFVDQNADSMESVFDGIPIYSDFNEIKESNIDYIFVMCRDYDSILREYSLLPWTHTPPRIMSMLYGHQLEKQRQFCALANEIYYNNIPGSIVELGVDNGETAKYINLFFDNRKFYLFDTFQGFSNADIEYERSLKTMTESMSDRYDNSSNEADVLKKMFYPELCVIKKGIFPDSLDGFDDVFAFVHIDCDLSKPIHAALEYFYPRLSIGGYICVHDYFNPKFPGVRKTVRDFVQNHNVKVVPVMGYNGVIISK
jgi:O-methyltransferase